MQRKCCIVQRCVLLTKRLARQDKNTFRGWRGKDSPLPSAHQAHPLYVQQVVGSVAPALVLYKQVFNENFSYCDMSYQIAILSDSAFDVPLLRNASSSVHSSLGTYSSPSPAH